MSEYPAEPWEQTDGTAWVIADDGYGNPIQEAIADGAESVIARAVACVNACAGMDDPAVEIASLRVQFLAESSCRAAAVEALDKLRAENEALRSLLVRFRDSTSAMPQWVRSASRDALARQPVENKEERPRIVCLCGSTRFMDTFRVANLRETIVGRIVLSIGCDTKSDADLLALGELTEAAKAALDELHKRKIDLADEILVLNVDGYIGASTRSEIDYAEAHGKPVRYLEPRSVETKEDLFRSPPTKGEKL